MLLSWAEESGGGGPSHFFLAIPDVDDDDNINNSSGSMISWVTNERSGREGMIMLDSDSKHYYLPPLRLYSIHTKSVRSVVVC